MKKVRFSLGLLLGLGLVLGTASGAYAQAGTFIKTYTWTLVETPGALGLWPNQLGAPSIFEADEGLLGRVVTIWDNVSCTAAGVPFACCTGFQTGTCAAAPYGAGAGDNALLSNDVVNFCQLAQGYPCEFSNYACTGAATPEPCCTGAGTGTCTGPPVMLFGQQGAPPANHEGPDGFYNNTSECNKAVAAACGSMPIGATAPDHLAGTDGHTENGSYSYLVLHKDPTGKGISFLSGTFTTQVAIPDCNGCATTGQGKDNNNAYNLAESLPAYPVQTLDIDLWTTQGTPFAGHSNLSLDPDDPPDAGVASLCGNGVGFQDVVTDLCADGAPGTPNFTIPDQKVVFANYSVNLFRHANFTFTERCNPPNCYIERVIIPAALAQSGGTANTVQVQKATSVLPTTAPLGLANATVDTLIFAWTTQVLDLDTDGIEDYVDLCPSDATDFCTTNQFTSTACPAGEVFCIDLNGDAVCQDPSLCNYRMNTDNDAFCVADSVDLNMLTGFTNGFTADEAFGTGVAAGP